MVIVLSGKNFTLRQAKSYIKKNLEIGNQIIEQRWYFTQNLNLIRPCLFKICLFSEAKEESSKEKPELKKEISEKPKINSKAGENIIEKEKIESGTVIISKQNKQFISSYI